MLQWFPVIGLWLQKTCYVHLKHPGGWNTILMQHISPQLIFRSISRIGSSHIGTPVEWSSLVFFKHDTAVVSPVCCTCLKSTNSLPLPRCNICICSVAQFNQRQNFGDIILQQSVNAVRKLQLVLALKSTIKPKWIIAETAFQPPTSNLWRP